MSKSNTEMEDTEKDVHASEQKVQESENKAIDDDTEGEGEKLPCTAAVSDDANKTENSGEDINESRNVDNSGDKDNNIEGKEQTVCKSEGSEPIEGSTQEQSNTIDESRKLINTKTDDEKQPVTESAVEGQKGAKDEAFQQNITCGGEKEEESAENCLNSGNHLKIVEEKSNEDLVEKEPRKLAKGDARGTENVAGDNKTISEGDADYIENVAGHNKTISKGAADCIENVSGDNPVKLDDAENDPCQNRQLPTEQSTDKAPQMQNPEMGEVDETKDLTNLDGDKTVNDDTKELGGEIVLAKCETDENVKAVVTTAKHDEDTSFANQHEPSTPNSLIRDSLAKTGDNSGGAVKSPFTPTALPQLGENDDGTPEEQAAFMKEIENFYRQRTMDFKPPKFYGQPLNCLKLWRAVIRLGGYDRVTGSKLWRQVGESFHPPKTCTTVSWTFRIFYEKSLLEYERHKTQCAELQLPVVAFPEASVDVEGNGYQGSVRARREAASRAMQGWHAQRLSDYGEVGEPIIKDKNLNNVPKREKNLKSIGSLKQKRPSEAEHSNKVARTETSKQLVTSVVDVGPPAEWVKINVQQTKDCFEIYALVPGLLREEVRVQTDPAGRVVITGQPEQVDNPWGITSFRKVVSLPSRIDPLQTSAVVSLHGRLFIRVPFEQPNV